MTRRPPRAEPASILVWQQLSPMTRLAWCVTGLAVAAVLLVLTWPPDTFITVLVPAQGAVASALGAARAWLERRAARDGRPGPAWDGSLYTGLGWLLVAVLVPVFHPGVRGWWLLGCAAMAAWGCYHVLRALRRPGDVTSRSGGAAGLLRRT